MNKDLINWAKTQRKLMELHAAEVAKTADDKTIVEIAVGFPYYKQDMVHQVGEICRDPDTEQPKKCVTEYDGSVQTDWTIKTGTLWYAYHGISKETAYQYVPPTGAHDIYKAGEFMTFTDGQIYKCLADTSYSPADLPDSWEVQE